MIKQKKPIGKQQPNPLFAQRYDGTVQCPWCESMNSKLSSPFGSTVSEMIFTCGDCGDTFGWMKWEQRRDHIERRGDIKSSDKTKSSNNHE